MRAFNFYRKYNFYINNVRIWILDSDCKPSAITDTSVTSSKCHLLSPCSVTLIVYFFLAHQTEIAILFAWVIKLHLTQVFSPRQKIAQNLEINQILGVVVQEKESNMVFCSRWKFPTLGMTVLSGTSAEPRFHSAQSSLGLETYI